MFLKLLSKENFGIPACVPAVFCLFFCWFFCLCDLVCYIKGQWNNLKSWYCVIMRYELLKSKHRVHLFMQISFFFQKKMVLCVAKFPISYPFTSIYIFNFFIFDEYKINILHTLSKKFHFTLSLWLLNISHISAGFYQIEIKRKGEKKNQKQVDHFTLA